MMFSVSTMNSLLSDQSIMMGIFEEDLLKDSYEVNIKSLSALVIDIILMHASQFIDGTIALPRSINIVFKYLI